MKHISTLNRGFICALCFLAVGSSAFAKGTNDKTGIVTALTMDASKKTVTVTLALGTIKAPDKSAAPVQNGKQPCRRPEISDLVELSGETVTFTVSADTVVGRSDLLRMAVAANTTAAVSTEDSTDAAAQDRPLPPPPFGLQDEHPECMPSAMGTEIADVSLNDVLTVSFDTDGTTVTNVSEDVPEPPHGSGPDGRMEPPPSGSGTPSGPQGGFGGGHGGNGIGAPSGGRR